MSKLSVEDLKRIKASKQGLVNLRSDSHRVKITVHMGRCGIAAGARTVIKTLLEKIGKHHMNDVVLASSGCAELCSQEPMITVEAKDMPPVKYGKLTAEKTTTIFDEHILKGNPVPEYQL